MRTLTGSQLSVIIHKRKFQLSILFSFAASYYCLIILNKLLLRILAGFAGRETAFNETIRPVGVSPGYLYRNQRGVNKKEQE